MKARILEFAAEVLESSGCLVEPGADGTLEAVLTPQAAQALGSPEVVRLTSMPEGRTGEPPTPPGTAAIPALSLGLDSVERVSGLLGDRGRAAEFWTGSLYLKREGLAARARERLSFADAALRVAEPQEGVVSWLRLAYRWTAISEEKREGLVEEVIDERTGVLVPDLLSRWERVPRAEGAAPQVDRLPGDVLIRRLRALFARRVRAELGPFKASLERRLARDVRRVREYYDGVAQEIRRKIERRRRQGSELETEVGRVQATEAERERKLAGLAERYALSVKLRPLVLERCVAPATLVPLTVMRKKIVRQLTLVWNPVLKDLEPLPCDGCGEAGWAFKVCRDAAHLLCSRCPERCPRCGKAACPACRPAGCPCASAGEPAAHPAGKASLPESR